MIEQNAIDWATGELLAFGSVLMDGHPVRLVGQDTRRGTFGQRHAVLVDRHTGAEHTPLRAFNSATARFHVYDSLLSEYAAVGFEYGYSVARPDALVCWEAQFGDFVNGAQTILDEFLSSGEQKWGQQSSVVLLLPHGYEGQGPDHSSARIERFLGLCAQGNMTVALPTTPANYFHLLRWQALSGRRTPLVVFTPKSMLRLKESDLAGGRVLRRGVPSGHRGCSRAGPGWRAEGAALLGQGVLRPGRPARTRTARRTPRSSGWSGCTRCPMRTCSPSWAATRPARRSSGSQEEPANMGAWPTMALKLPDILGRPVGRISVPASSAPAVGSALAHKAEHEHVVADAVGRG